MTPSECAVKYITYTSSLAVYATPDVRWLSEVFQRAAALQRRKFATKDT